MELPTWNASGESALASGKTPHLLLVDDEPHQLELRSYVMKLQGYSVDVVSDPRQAVSTIARQQTDLAVLDYDMPFVNGCDLACQLKRVRPALKIILHSGLVEVPEDNIEYIDAFVPKGVGVAPLLAEISELLHRKIA